LTLEDTGPGNDLIPSSSFNQEKDELNRPGMPMRSLTSHTKYKQQQDRDRLQIDANLLQDEESFKTEDDDPNSMSSPLYLSKGYQINVVKAEDISPLDIYGFSLHSNSG
jgi:hypothetical protein